MRSIAMSQAPAVSFPNVINIADLRRIARRRLPAVVFDYLDGGAEDEVTLRANRSVFKAVTFRPCHAVTLPERTDLRCRVLGLDLSFPAILAPVGYSRLMHPDGECGAAKAAGIAGTAYTLSTISGHALEKVMAATTGPAWYQLYMLGGREAAEASINRARRAGYSALVVTIDTAVAGSREKDVRNGMRQLMGGNAFSKIPFLPNLIAHPKWLAGFLLDGGVPGLPNVVVPGHGPMPLLEVGIALARAAVNWEDLRWIQESWRGPIIIKGVLTAEDAQKSVDYGAAAIVVSNHGGRQLDGVSSTLRVLPEIVKAVGGRTEILFDGGIRRGSDIVKAICLGAKAVLIGRAYAYGLSAAGTQGVSRALNILRDEVDRTVKLLGCPSLAALDGTYIDAALLR
jgi:isopentenyl diphosphate isomerase/L-lactate dehydrogenase-like FMN-dependent dehydrogenase